MGTTGAQVKLEDDYEAGILTWLWGHTKQQWPGDILWMQTELSNLQRGHRPASGAPYGPDDPEVPRAGAWEPGARV